MISGGDNLKALQITEYGGPEVLKYVNVEEPTPKAGEVKVKLFATGLNPSESYTISGNYAYNIPELPYVPGYDGAGIIEEIGENVTKLKVGDRVFMSVFSAKRSTGTYAEKIVVDASRVFPLPENISFEEGAGLGIPAFTAYKAIHQVAKVKAGEIVLIHGGSGAVGSLAIQMAKAIGAVVIGTSSTQSGQELILRLGADFTLNHINEDTIEEIIHLTDGNGPDVIIEMLANHNLETDSKMIAKYGRIVVVGSRGTIDFTPRNLMTNEASVTGMTFTYPEEIELKEMVHGLNTLLNDGTLKPIIGNRHSLDEPIEAYHSLMKSSGNGRTIFVINEEK